MNRKHLETADEIEEDAASPHSAVKRTMGSSGTHMSPTFVISDVHESADKKPPSVIKSLLPIAMCWMMLLFIMALRIYYTTLITENNRKLTEEIQRLRAQQSSLRESVTGFEWTNKPCQTGWHHFQSSCYAVINCDGPSQRTWEEAEKGCRGINAHLAVVGSPEEQEFIYNSSWSSMGTSGYWIGLRVKNGTWKWVDGRTLTSDYWIQRPSENAHCAISVEDESPKGWNAVDCKTINRWICEKKALPV